MFPFTNVRRLNFTINLGNLIEQSFERGICVYFKKKEIFETLARVLNDNLYKLGCIHEKEAIVKTTGILR